MSAAQRLLCSYEKGENENKENTKRVKAKFENLENLNKPGEKQTFQDRLNYIYTL
jgi:hypothetical protein